MTELLNMSKNKSIIDGVIISVIVFVLFGTMAILITNTYLQWKNYDSAIQSLIANDPANIAILSYSRAMDFSVAKMTSLCFGFLLVFIGALFLLKLNQVSYALEISGRDSKISLQTASPGLVLATLGVLVIIFTISAKSYVSLRTSYPSQSPVPSAGDTISNADLDILFDKGSANISEAEIKKINSICYHFKNIGYPTIRLEGFANGDESRIVNMSLSERRSEALRDYLIAACNYPLSSIETVSYGEERPGFSDENRSMVRIN